MPLPRHYSFSQALQNVSWGVCLVVFSQEFRAGFEVTRWVKQVPCEKRVCGEGGAVCGEGGAVWLLLDTDVTDLNNAQRKLRWQKDIQTS